jgi:hypothetical protein
MGTHIDYRRYREPIPNKVKETGNTDEDIDVDEEDEDEDEDDNEDDNEEEDEEEDFDDRYADLSRDPSYKGRCWPKTAWHTEGYFEETFDAARHGICEFFCIMSLKIIRLVVRPISIQGATGYKDCSVRRRSNFEFLLK